jgi:hypothetical protein
MKVKARTTTLARRDSDSNAKHDEREHLVNHYGCRTHRRTSGCHPTTRPPHDAHRFKRPSKVS